MVSCSFLDETGHLEHLVPDIAEVPPFERPPFAGAHGVRRRRPATYHQPPPGNKNVRRHDHQTVCSTPFCLAGTMSFFFIVIADVGFLIGRRRAGVMLRRPPGAAPPLPARDLDRRSGG